MRQWIPKWSPIVWTLIGLTLLILLIVVLAAGLWVVETCWITVDASRNKLHYWLQIFTGNWSVQSAYQPSEFYFSLIASIAIILNIGPPLAILTYLFKIATDIASNQRERTMILSQALRVKDEVTKQKLISLFNHDPGTIDRIEEGFRLADEKWEEALTATMGRKVAQFVFSTLKRELPSPK